MALLFTCPPLKWEIITEWQKSALDNPSFSVCWFLAACSFLSPQVLKGSHWHPIFLFYVTNPTLCFETGPERPNEKSRWSYLCGRPQAQQKWRVSFSSVSQTPMVFVFRFGPNQSFCFYTEWLSLHPAVTWRMPSPSLMGQSWMDARLRSLRTAEGELFSHNFSWRLVLKLCLLFCGPQ